MSEYQYYEFRAIDRPLTRDEMSELRLWSSRAKITSTSFVNEYNWGRFKGNPDEWMEKYFDAYLYVANWGTRILEFRLPASQLDLDLVGEYWDDHYVTFRQHQDKIIISFMAEEIDDETWFEAKNLLPGMISIRQELANGDLRAFYLAWLASQQGCELNDDQESEPPVPPGLGQLSESLDSLVTFLNIDEDLIAAAAENSPPLKKSVPDRSYVQAWIADLPAEDKDKVLTNFLVDSGVADLNALRIKFQRENNQSLDADSKPCRSVRELLGSGKRRKQEVALARAKLDAEKAAQRKVAEANEREKYLGKLSTNEPKTWLEVENLISSKVPKKYDEAVQLLIDLQDVYIRENRVEFGTAIEKIRGTHANKRTFLERLVKAGL